MTSTAHERHFWELAYCAALQNGTTDPGSHADRALTEWRRRWPDAVASDARADRREADATIAALTGILVEGLRHG